MAIAAADRWHIGRTQLFNGESLKPGPQTMTQIGDDLRLTGTYWENTELPIAVFRQQFLGLSEETEAVPLIAPDEYGLTGFYMVKKTQFVHQKAGELQGWGEYSITLERVSSYAAPRFELIGNAGNRDDEPLYTTADPTHLIAIDADANFAVNPAASSSATDRTTEDGTVQVIVWTESVSLIDYTSHTVQYVTSAANFYKSACKIEWKVGSTWYPIIGRQLPELSTVADVRISNGLVRTSFAASGVVTCETWDTSAWVTVNTAEWYHGTQGATYDVWADDDDIVEWSMPTVQVLTNRPERVTIMLPAVDSVTGNLTGNMIVTVGRGDLFTNFTHEFVRYGVLGGYCKIIGGGAQASAPYASTPETRQSAIRRITNDTNGHRWVALSAEVDYVTFETAGTTHALVYRNSPEVDGAKYTVGICAIRDWASPPTYADSAEVADQFWSGGSTTERFVAS